MRLLSSLLLTVSLASLTAACSSEAPTNSEPNENEGCDNDKKVGKDCTCDDDAEGSYECVDDELECVCEDAVESPSKEDDDQQEDDEEPPPAKKDSGTKDAGKTETKDAGVTPPKDAGGSTESDASTDPPVTGGQAGQPKLPAINGECPVFKDGTIMVAGHRGVMIQAGAAGKGGPLLFYWHGTGGSAQEVNRTVPAAVRQEIINAGGIIASFNGSQSSKTGADCSGTGAHNQADFNAADQIAACAVKNHGIDPTRIYATGCSAGGLQSGCMAQMRSSYMAAVAPNSGGVVFPQKWQDSHTPAVFTMHGGPSDMVIVTFSETSATFDKSSKDHGGFVVNCNHGGGHCQAPAPLQTAAWKFMKEHPFGVSPEPWKSIPSGIPDYCKIY